MKQRARQKGFSTIEVIIIGLVILATALGGWFVWQRSEDDPDNSSITQNSTNKANDSSQQTETKDETANWTSVTTQGGAFTMKVPDGWKITNYPGDFLGSTDVQYKAGVAAIVESSKTEYAGHLLRFRASVTTLDDAGLGPQWASPQPGLQESNQDFSVDGHGGKRYKGRFSGDLNQTLYEYVFDLGDNKKLDILYTIYSNEGEIDDVTTVEKAIQTIRLN